MVIKQFDTATVQSLAKILGDTDAGFTGTQITNLLIECNIDDPQIHSTKWRRIEDALTIKQKSDRCANNIIAFIQRAMMPSRHYDKHEWFETTRSSLNKVLSFEGFELQANGQVHEVSITATISESEERATKLKKGLLARKVHPDVLTYCKSELLVDNYFHAVFEATKSIAGKIRDKTGLTGDGAALADEAFSLKTNIPHLALNALVLDSEKSEQKGFCNLIKGVFGTFRNTAAHEPKITWVIEEQDALDILSTISLIHRRLDSAITARIIYQNHM